MAEKRQRIVKRRLSGPDETELILREMGEENYQALSQLFKQHPAISDMETSPGPEELDVFHDQLNATSYVQGLFRFGHLRKALDLLEQGYQGFRSAHCVPVTDAALTVQKRKEREIRFIMRMAAVLGPAFRAIQIPANVEQNIRQEELVSALHQVRRSLVPLLKDEFFREDLAADWRVEVLRRLLDDTTKACAWLGPASYRPVKNQDKCTIEASASTAPTRLIANRLADSAFRVYANCDDGIMKCLLGYKWLETISAKTMKGLINEALERKIEQFSRICPNEDYIGHDLFGAWSVSRDIDPPWMTA